MFFTLIIGDFTHKKRANLNEIRSFQTQKNYFTSSLKLLPAENAGTVLAAIFNSLPV